MGGHHSKQSVKVSSRIVANAAVDVAQNCLAYMDGTQVINIHGSGNVFEGNIQRSQLSVDMKCVDQMSQKGEFETKLRDSIAQELKDQEVATTEWMDPSGDSQATDIRQAIETNIKFSDVQDCMASLNGTQLFVVDGSNNVIVDNMQEQTMTLAEQCLLSGSQTANVVNNVTNTVNQHSTYDSQNPLAFVTDAIEATLESAMAIAAVVFVAIVVLVLVFEVGTRSERRAPTLPALPPLGT